MSDTNQSSSRHERAGLFDRLRTLFGAPQTSVREDIEDALEEASENDLSAQERAMLRSVLGLHELRVRDIMVPRTDITAVEKSDTLGHVLNLFRTAGHSRLPVYEDSLDSPQGMVHIRDFLELLARPDIDRHLAAARVDRGDLRKWFEDKKVEVLNDGKVVPAASPNTDFFPRDEYYLNRP